MSLQNRLSLSPRSSDAVGPRSRSVSRYVRGLANTYDPYWPLAKRWRPLTGGIPGGTYQPLTGGMAPDTWFPSAGFGDDTGVDGLAEDIGTALGNAVDSRTKKLETALTVILGLSAIAAMTGVFNLMKR